MPDSDQPAPPSSPAIEQLLEVAEARARELEPLAAEFARLRQVILLLRQPDGPQQIAHLDVLSNPSLLDAVREIAGSETIPPTATPAPLFKGRHGTRPGRDGRAPQGSNKQRIMGTIAEHPGIRSRDIAGLTGLKRSIVNSTLTRLKRQGEVTVVDGGLHVAPDALVNHEDADGGTSASAA